MNSEIPLWAYVQGAAIEVEHLDSTDRTSKEVGEKRSGNEANALENLRAPLEDFSVDDARALLDENFSPDVLYPEWVEVVMALRHQFPREPQLTAAYQVFHEWSAKGTKYEGPDDTLKKWRSVRQTPIGRLPITIRTLLHKVRQLKEASRIISARELLNSPPTRPAELIEGILFKRGKLIIAAPSKARKTWANIDLAVSVATAKRWLGHATQATPVLYLDFELSDYDFWFRLKDVMDAKFVESAPELYRFPLRGRTLQLEILLPKITEFVNENRIGLIVIDPLYAALRGRDENSNSEMTDLMLELELLAQKTGTAVAIVHHFAKGNASGKEAQDRMSGAGALARAADTMLILTPHGKDTDEQPIMVAEFITRSFKKPPRTVVKWTHPLWMPDSSMSPDTLKAAAGRKKKYTVELIASTLAGAGETYNDLFKKLHDQTGMSKSTFNHLLKEACDHGGVQKAGTWYSTML